MEAARGQTDVPESRGAVRGRDTTVSAASGTDAGSRDVAFGLGVMAVLAFAALVSGIIASVS